MASGRLRETLRAVDWVLFGATVLLVAVGLATLFSVTLNVEAPRIDKFYRQLASCGLGLVVLLGALRFDYRWIRSASWALYALGIASLAALFLVGTTLRGTTGWFSFFGSTFQPVELMKVVLVVALARLLAGNLDAGATWSVIGRSMLVVALPILLVLLQPDLGSALLLGTTWLGMLLFLRIPMRRFLVIILGLAVVATAGWFLLHDYQRNRVLTFLDPNRDPLRSGYNVRQSILAIGSGQLFGRGLGLGTQSQLNFLPTQDTDFIFAVLAEELGFVGVVILLGLFSIFLARLLRGFRVCRDPFGSLLIAGFFVLFGSELLLNVGGNVGLLPLTGTPLPFLSYGGSALISSLFAVGLCLNVMARSTAR